MNEGLPCRQGGDYNPEMISQNKQLELFILLQGCYPFPAVKAANPRLRPLPCGQGCEPTLRLHFFKLVPKFSSFIDEISRSVDFLFYSML
jgi:hypothetical protein